MRKSLGTLALVAIVVAIVGSARNWFEIDRTQSGDETQLNIKIDRQRIRADAQQAAQVARELGSNIEQRVDDRLPSDQDPSPETLQEKQPAQVLPPPQFR